MTVALQRRGRSAITGTMTVIDTDLIRARRFEIDREIADLRNHIDVLESELKELEMAEGVMLRLIRHAGGKPAALPPPPPVGEEEDKLPGKPEGIPTMPDMIIKVLREYPEGLEPKDIAAVIDKRWWPGVPVNGVGPIAWRMWKRGQLAKNDSLYTLPEEKAAGDKSVRDTPAALNNNPEHDREAGRGGGT